MLMFYMLMLTSMLIFFTGSTHSLSFLLLLESMVLASILIMLKVVTSWFSCLMLLMVAVCLGVYGISLLISVSRSKGMTFFFSL